MLAFFDYLRQRACESVLAGAQEALAFLESQKDRHEPEALDYRSGKLTNEQGTWPNENSCEEDDEPLPAPRDRGRPKQKPKGDG